MFRFIQAEYHFAKADAMFTPSYHTLYRDGDQLDLTKLRVFLNDMVST